MNIKKILALGAGAMGRQVSFYYAMRGFDVVQFDISEEALAACEQYHHGYVEPFGAVNPAFTAKDSAAGLGRVSYTTDLAAAAKNADLVTESVPEVLAIKQKIYTELNQYCPAHTIFSTNTSAMRPSDIARSAGRPERFLALHYGMEIWGSPIAEVMKHPGTDDAIFRQVVDFVEASKLVPIKLEKEQPGYIINSLLIPWLIAGLSLVVNGISSYQDVDKAWMICGQGMRKGPIGVIGMLEFEVLRNVHRLLAEAEPSNPQYQKISITLKSIFSASN